MQLRVFTEPQQGASYSQLLSVAQRAELVGFDAFFRSDHYQKMGTHVTGLPGPSDAWITLAGIARETSTIRLGTLVNSATFRNPGVLAISVANVDDMSGGRVELGLGAGWYVDEHRSYGITFPELGTRFDILTEQLAVITGLWNTPHGEKFSYNGTHYNVVDSPALPKPVQSPPPIIVGGGGPRRTPRLAALYAAEFNLPFSNADAFVAQRDRVRSACDAVQRDPDSLIYSVAQVVCVGSTPAEIARRAARIGRDVDELRQNGICGTPDEVIEKISSWTTTGASRMYLQVLDLDDLDHISLIGETVLPHVK
jgi:F420-dependent oxidoreductase-like protein